MLLVASLLTIGLFLLLRLVLLMQEIAEILFDVAEKLNEEDEWHEDINLEGPSTDDQVPFS